MAGRQTEFRAAIAQAVSYAGALHCPRVNCLAGNMPDDASPEECWDVLVENLRDAAYAFAVQNIELLIEPLNRIDNPRFILNGTQNTLDLITAAFGDGKAKADRAAAEKMQALTEGLPLPPGMKLPF